MNMLKNDKKIDYQLKKSEILKEVNFLNEGFIKEKNMTFEDTVINKKEEEEREIWYKMI